MSSFKTTNAQKNNPYELINNIPQILNAKFAIIDSLVPMTKINKKELMFLSKKELKELKKLSLKSEGMKIDYDSIVNYTLFPAETIFKAFEYFDSTAIQLFKDKSYYLLSNPLFFSGGSKVIMRVSLIKGYGSLYILERKENEWKVLKNIYQWM